MLRACTNQFGDRNDRTAVIIFGDRKETGSVEGGPKARDGESLREEKPRRARTA